MDSLIREQIKTTRAIKKAISESNKIVIMSGAGVSTNSGIPDFRSIGGLYEGKNVEYYLSRNYYKSFPYDFWNKYKSIFHDKLLSKTFHPNNAHYFAKYLMDLGKDVTVITQNVDGLYSKVDGLVEGENVYSIHGEIETYFCPTCHKEYDKEYINNNEIPYCEDDDCGDILDTNVVLFGDNIKYREEVTEAVMESDLMFVMGTSLEVYPFNYFVDLPSSITRVFLNKQLVKRAMYFDHILLGDLHSIINNIQK